jgi:hypothetical protein
LKNVDYQSSNLELEQLGLSPDKARTAQPIEGDSDTDFAVAVDSGVDEDYHNPGPDAENPQVQLKKERQRLAKGSPVPTQIRQGMAKKKSPVSHHSSQKISSGEMPATAQKKTTVSKAVSTESSVFSCNNSKSP